MIKALCNTYTLMVFGLRSFYVEFYGIGAHISALLSIVIIGGLGNLHGAFWASTFMVLLPEILRFVGLPDSIGANMRQIIYGLILIGVIFWQERSENR